MLQGMTVASPPAALMPSATSWQASALREETTTLAPSFASSSAEERPMPRLGAVTTATLPVRSTGVFFIGVGLRCIHLFGVIARLDRAIQYSRDGAAGIEGLPRTGSPAYAGDDSNLPTKSPRHRPPRGAGGSRCHRTSSRSWSGA